MSLAGMLTRRVAKRASVYYRVRRVRSRVCDLVRTARRREEAPGAHAGA